LDEEPVTLPPDIAERQTLAPPAKVENDKQQSPEDPDEPDLEIEVADNEGDLPNELLEEAPPAPSSYPYSELPKPPVVAQPVAISLNEE
jgi:hypothetical protein